MFNVRALALVLLTVTSAGAQLFEALQSSVSRYTVGDPEIRSTISPEGPKGIVAADFDSDGSTDFAVSNADGTVTLVFFQFTQGENSVLEERFHLDTGGLGLRQIVVGDINSDSRPDILAASPFDGKVYVFLNEHTAETPRSFSRTEFDAGFTVRNLALADFDGDGDLDLTTGGRQFGINYYSGDNIGNFQSETNLPQLTFNFESAFTASPVFILRTFIPPGKSLPALVATHAQSDTFYVYEFISGSMQVTGSLQPQLSVNPGINFTDFQIGQITSPITGAIPDLIASSNRWNSVAILRGQPDPPYFSPIPFQEIPVASGPRFTGLDDRDNDGWNELYVMQREGDQALIFDNDRGVITLDPPLESIPLGRSPREFLTSDLDADGTPDIAAVNRKSNDVSIILSSIEPTPSSPLPFATYPTDASPAAIALEDLDGDSQAEVIQLHRASGDISVRAALPGGALGQPVYYAMGLQPNQMRLADFNADGTIDVSTSNLGQGSTPGSLGVRYGNGDGSFGNLQLTTLPQSSPDAPEGAGGRLFALVDGDFDGDGISDQVAGYFDCRIQFFKGLPDGSYEAGNIHEFVYESRIMVAGDFDQDGDLDLFGAGEGGQAISIRNNGDLFTTENLERHIVAISAKNGLRSANTVDLSGDGDPDIIVGTAGGALLFIGGEGVTFVGSTEFSTNQGSLPFSDDAAAVAVSDFDKNGSLDAAIACSRESVLTIATISGEVFTPVIEALPVPSAEYIASGDIDGDGFSDLAGTGNVLWVALSGAGAPPSDEPTSLRTNLAGPVINELLAKNDSIPVPAAGGASSDFIEIYNGGDSSLDLSGWSLSLVESAGSTETYPFPDGETVRSGDRITIVFSNNIRDNFHTGFTLPRESATVSLVSDSGEAIDSITYPDQEADVSYARYTDGANSLVFNPFPDPGRKNLSNGGRSPSIGRPVIDPNTLKKDTPLRFFVEASDDLGIVSLTLSVRRLDDDTIEPFRVILFDDGFHDDGDGGDGLYSGLLEPGLPAGGAIEFYIDAVSLNGNSETDPGSAMFTSPGIPIQNYSIGFPSETVASANTIQISEIVSIPDGSFPASDGSISDWIEVRNISGTSASTTGLSISQRILGADESDIALLPEDSSLNEPGGYAVFFADDPDGFPFGIADSGETIYLSTTDSTTGATILLDSFDLPELASGTSYSRIGTGDHFYIGTPTPAQQNLDTPLLPFLSETDDFTLYYQTSPTGSTILETLDTSSEPPTWIPIETLSAPSPEGVYTEPDPSGSSIFRTRFEP